MAAASGQQGTCCAGLACNGVFQNINVCRRRSSENRGGSLSYLTPRANDGQASWPALAALACSLAMCAGRGGGRSPAGRRRRRRAGLAAAAADLSCRPGAAAALPLTSSSRRRSRGGNPKVAAAARAPAWSAHPDQGLVVGPSLSRAGPSALVRRRYVRPGGPDGRPRGRPVRIAAPQSRGPARRRSRPERSAVARTVPPLALAALGDVPVRVLGPEDQLRLLCLHLARHGISRPLWLCDIGACLESSPPDFDWDCCLRGSKTLSDWTTCVLGAGLPASARPTCRDGSRREARLPGLNRPCWVLGRPGSGEPPGHYLRHPFEAVRRLRPGRQPPSRLHDNQGRPPSLALVRLPVCRPCSFSSPPPFFAGRSLTSFGVSSPTTARVPSFSPSTSTEPQRQEMNETSQFHPGQVWYRWGAKRAGHSDAGRRSAVHRGRPGTGDWQVDAAGGATATAS